MNSTNIIFGVFLLAFCQISLSYSLRCFVCNSEESCRKAQLYHCNQSLANATHIYLQQYHTGIHTYVNSSRFECFNEFIQTKSSKMYYKGCIYSNANYGCQLPLSFYMSSMTKQQTCSQCDNKDGCNIADRVNFNVMTLLTTVVVAVLLRYDS